MRGIGFRSTLGLHVVVPRHLADGFLEIAFHLVHAIAHWDQVSFEIAYSRKMRAADSDAIAHLEHLDHTDPRVDPACASFHLTRAGADADQCVVLLHGITSSPIQFRELADLFFARGFNVLVPRMPHHGYRDRLTRDQSHLSRDEMLDWLDHVIAAGHQLGRHVSVVGLSVSGTLAAWAYATRTDVDVAVPIAPTFAPAGVPIHLVPALARLTLLLPNMLVWWDPRVRDRLRNPAGYPRFATHPMAAAFLLGADVFARADRVAPRGRSAVVITNPRDMAVSSRATRAVVERWQRHPGARVDHVQLDARIGRLHDVVGPYQPGARPDYVYPVILDAVTSAVARL